MTDKPNPGSREAVGAGCKCPVLDNGRGAGIGNGRFWVNITCPLHGRAEDITHKITKELNAERGSEQPEDWD